MKTSKLHDYVELIRVKADEMTTDEIRKLLFVEYGIETTTYNLQAFMNKQGIKRSPEVIKQKRKEINKVLSTMVGYDGFGRGIRSDSIIWR